MTIPELSTSVNNVSQLPDKPTLTTTELKAVFDKAGIDIKTYLNTILKPLLESSINGKVDSVTGKGLSANDFTNILLEKLNGIEAEANKSPVITSGITEPTSETVGDIYIQYFE